MSEQIKRNDLVQEGLFRDLAKEIDLATEALQRQTKEAKIVSMGYTDVAKSLKATSQDLATIIELEKKQKKVVEDTQKARLAEIKLQQDREKAFDRYEKQLQKEQAAREKAAKQAEKERIAAEKAAVRERKLNADKNNAYKQLAANTQKLKDESKRLGAELLKLEQAGRKNTTAYKALDKQYRDVTRSAQLGDSQLKKLDRTVGDNQRNVGNYTSALGGLNRVLGQLGIAFGVGFIARGTLDVMRDFDEGLADIQKTTGLSRDGVKELMDEILKIDTRTSVTALQELATSAGRLGIEGKQNILEFVQAADMAFVALGDDLGGTADEIATSLGKIAAIFGDEQRFGIGVAITKTGSVLNELSANSKATAGDILDFTNRLAGVSSQAGISQTDIQALGALFASTGQSVEVAATTLNTLLPELASNQEKYAKVAGMTSEAFADLLVNNPVAALKAVAVGANSSESGLVGLVETLGDFGVESARAASIVGVLASSTDELTRLQGIANTAFDEGTSLANEFNVKNQTLGASLEKLTKEFQKFVLGVDDAGNVTGNFGTLLQFLIDNLGTILSTIGKGIIAWGAYRAVLIAVQAKQFLLNGGLKQTVTGLLDVFKASKQTATGVDAAGQSVKGMGAALKSIIWVAIIAAVIELATAFYDVASGAKAAREQAELTAKYVARGAAFANKAAEGRAKALNDELRALENKRKLDLAAAKTDEQRAKIESDYLREKQRLIDVKNNEIKTDVRAANQRKQQYQEDLQRLRLLEKVYLAETNRVKQDRLFIKLQEEAFKIQQKYNLGTQESKLFGFIGTGVEEQRSFNEVVGALEARTREVNEKLTVYNGELEGVSANLQDATTDLEANTISQEDNTSKINAKIPTMRAANVEFAKMNEYISRQTDLLKEIADIETEQQIRQQERNLSDLLLGDEASIADAKVIIDEITNLRQEAINRQYDLDAQRLDEKLAAENKAERDALDKQREDLLKAAGDDAAAKKTIEDNYQLELDKIAERELQRAEDLALEKKLLEMKRVEDLLALENEREQRLNEINESLLSNQKDALTELNDAIAESAKELVNILNQLQSALVEMYTRSLDRKIDAAKKDEELAAEQVNRLQELANQGAILDEQSIADAERRRREAIAEQAELEKKKQRAEFISLALQNIANQLANGKTTGEALGSTVALQSAVKALFSGFNGFWKGTNNAPEGFAWVDEKGSEIHTDKHGNIKDFGQSGGARLKYLEKGDKIIPHHKSMELLNTTLPTVSDKKSVVVDPALDLLREQNRLLKNAVDSKITAEQLGSVIHMTTEDKKGNLARLNRYKYTK